MARLNRRYRKRRRNPDDGGGSRASGPPLISEIGEFVLPGFAGFAVTRFGTRVASTQIAQRFPNTTWSKHAGALTSVGAFLAAWLLAHKWKWLAKYQTPIVVGSAIAAIQSLIQIYVPQIGWVVADATPDLAAGTSTDPQLQGGTQSSLPAGMVPIDDDPNLYVYNNAYDAGNYAQPASGNRNPSATQQAADDEFADLEIEDANQSAGIFAPN